MIIASFREKFRCLLKFFIIEVNIYFESRKKITNIHYTNNKHAMEVKNIISGILPFRGKRGVAVTGAGVYLETGTGKIRIAFQRTGESGKVTFAHLDKGIYRILLKVPPQVGKLAVQEYNSGDFQVSYHSEKKMLLFRDAAGYFSIRFSNMKKLSDAGITPMYEMVEDRGKIQILTGKLEVVHNYGSISLELAAHTQQKFQKITTRYKDDAGVSVIKNNR
jgi:hypothetical protein